MQVRSISIQFEDESGVVRTYHRAEHVDPETRELTRDVRNLLSRALNTWDDAPAWLIDLDMQLEGLRRDSNRG